MGLVVTLLALGAWLTVRGMAGGYALAVGETEAPEPIPPMATPAGMDWAWVEYMARVVAIAREHGLSRAGLMAGGLSDTQARAALGLLEAAGVIKKANPRQREWAVRQEAALSRLMGFDGWPGEPPPV